MLYTDITRKIIRTIKETKFLRSWQCCSKDYRNKTATDLILLANYTVKCLDCSLESRPYGGRLITNFRYADDIIMIATSQSELQELIDCLDRAGKKKTKVMVNTRQHLQRRDRG